MYEIEAARYKEFQGLWANGSFGQQRLGQAFYNHFKLHAMADQTGLNALYEANSDQANMMIAQLFSIR